jgi:beta-glucuronidase
MPVPSSYQDLSNERERRDFFGWVWYDREFFVSPNWLGADKRLFLRFGSVNYHAIVVSLKNLYSKQLNRSFDVMICLLQWVNGVQVAEHRGGHLPFKAELSLTEINPTGGNRITVAVNNTLTVDTVPQGFVTVKQGEQ